MVLTTTIDLTSLVRSSGQSTIIDDFMKITVIIIVSYCSFFSWQFLRSNRRISLNGSWATQNIAEFLAVYIVHVELITNVERVNCSHFHFFKFTFLILVVHIIVGICQKTECEHLVIIVKRTK